MSAARLRALGTSLGLVLLLGVALVLPVLGAEPSMSPEGLLASGDPRSEGGGPGIVGSPLLILVAVVALGLATAAVTLAAVRLHRTD